MSRATDGRDRNGCNLKNIHNFFKLVAFCLVECEQSLSFPNFFRMIAARGEAARNAMLLLLLNPSSSLALICIIKTQWLAPTIWSTKTDCLQPICLGVFTKNMIMIYSLFENLLDIFLSCFISISCKTKALSFNLGQF